MKTFKTLIRKSDGQWMRIKDNDIILSEYPVKMSEESFKILQINARRFDWSLYFLEEVAVVPVKDIPSEKEIEKQFTHDDPHYPNMNLVDKRSVKAIEWYKSQIFK